MSTQESSAGSALAPRFGRHGPRSKSGCTTCRTRKVKCDETRPLCKRCEKAQTTCDWNQPVIRRLPVSRRRWTRRISQLNTISEQTPGPSQAGTPCEVDLASVPPTTPTVSNPPTTGFALLPGPTSTGPGYALSPTNVHSNALFLSPQDLESFDYIPRSFMVLRFGKPWRWSMLSYVHSRIAFRESGVMRAFIAVASMELRSRELVKTQDTPQTSEAPEKARSFKENASHALHLAMQDLSQVLDRLSDQPNDHGNLEVLFSMWFLVLHFGIYDSDLVQASYMHLNGMCSFIAEYFHGTTARRICSLPPAAKQLLVYICYLDVMLALGGMGGGHLTIDLMNAPAESPVCFNRLFEEARVCVPQLWGSEYPAEELLDDIENYRPLKFVHACQKLKLSVWRLGLVVFPEGDEAPRPNSRDLWTDIEQLGEDFYDVRLLAGSIRRTDGRRVIWTVYHACLDFYALQVLYSCIEDSNSQPEWLQDVLTKLLEIAHKALNEDPQQVYRYAWALRVALFRVRDPIHRDWLEAQIVKASALLSNLGIPSEPFATDGAQKTLFVENSRIGSRTQRQSDTGLTRNFPSNEASTSLLN